MLSARDQRIGLIRINGILCHGIEYILSSAFLTGRRIASSNTSNDKILHKIRKAVPHIHIQLSMEIKSEERSGTARDKCHYKIPFD